MIPSVQRIRILGTPFSVTLTTTAICRMTSANRGNSNDDAHYPVSAVNEEEVRHDGKDHQEDCVSGVVKSCCGDNGGDFESAVNRSRCGNMEGNDATEEFARKDDSKGTIMSIVHPRGSSTDNGTR